MHKHFPGWEITDSVSRLKQDKEWDQSFTSIFLEVSTELSDDGLCDPSEKTFFQPFNRRLDHQINLIRLLQWALVDGHWLMKKARVITLFPMLPQNPRATVAILAHHAARMGRTCNHYRLIYWFHSCFTKKESLMVVNGTWILTWNAIHPFFTHSLEAVVEQIRIHKYQDAWKFGWCLNWLVSWVGCIIRNTSCRKQQGTPLTSESLLDKASVCYL